jgi:esterase/lipase superfamily enzyme
MSNRSQRFELGLDLKGHVVMIGKPWLTAWLLGCCFSLASSLVFAQSTSDGLANDPQASANRESEAVADPPPAAASEEAAINPGEDWAAAILEQDPLAGQQEVSLDDLWRAIEDEQQRRWVIDRHFRRVTASEAERRQFLEQAFHHPDPLIQQQAARALQRRGELADVVRSMLLEWIESGDSDRADLAIVGLSHLPLSQQEVDPELLDALLRALGAESKRVSDAAAEQLRRLGAAAVPRLIEAMEADGQAREQAAEVLSQILSEWEATSEPRVMTPTPPITRATPESVVVKGTQRGEAIRYLERRVDEQHPETVRVYYGTNRMLIRDPEQQRIHPVYWVGLILGCILASLWLFTHGKPTTTSWLRWIFRRTLITAVVLVLMMIAALQLNDALFALGSNRGGIQFGPRRSQEATIHYGYCDVSIPPTHSVGAVERPTLGPEDEAQHVILQRVALLEQTAFYEAVRQALTASGDTTADCLLFIHGYNVSFDEAARRAAQIHFDLQFHGATMFYSWPSRASFRHYFSDRNEIGYSHALIKRFLQGILENLEFRRFHIIAHSMGADALCQAVMELDPEGKIFDQIILAAPDIDAETFKDQILPQLQQCGTRTTLYCSRNDFALYASKHFNDGRRAGDSSEGPLVAAGLDTIDATDMDTEMLGHSYYGNCLPLLEDLQQLIEQNRPPEQRNLEPLLDVSQMRYWVFVDGSP